MAAVSVNQLRSTIVNQRPRTNNVKFEDLYPIRDDLELLVAVINSVSASGIQDWATATSYDVGDDVFENNLLYTCLIAHTSGVFATDLSAGRWQLVHGGLATTLGVSNSTGANDIDITEGQSIIYNTAAGGPFTGSLSGPTLTGNRTWTLPDNTGTIALLSDVQAADELSEVLSNGNSTGGNDIILTSSDVIKSSVGGGQIQMELSGFGDNVTATTDNGVLGTPFFSVSNDATLGVGAKLALDNTGLKARLELDNTAGSISLIGAATNPLVKVDSTDVTITVGNHGLVGNTTNGFKLTKAGGGEPFLDFESGALKGTLTNATITSSNKTWTLPDKSGTIALISDVEASDTLSEVLANGNTTGGNNIQFSTTDTANFSTIWTLGADGSDNLVLTSSSATKDFILTGFDEVDATGVSFNVQNLLTNEAAAGTVITFNQGVNLLKLDQPTITGTRTQTFQDATGTIALLSDIPSGFTQGSVFFADATGDLTEDNANLFYDSATAALGIGTNTLTPGYNLVVDGNAIFGSGGVVIEADPSFRIDSGGNTNTKNFSVENNVDGEYFTITTSGGDGRVGINKASPVATSRLHVGGKVVFDDTLSIGATSFSDGTNIVAVKTGTTPTTDVTDAFQIYSSDIVAGNAAPHFRTEAGDIVKLYEEAAVTDVQGIADALTTLGLLASSTITDAGATTFLELTDTPANYTSSSLNLVRVNSGETALEFLDETSDFLSQYALLAGRSGGQTLIGGTASGNDLTLQSTSNATKGSILFGTSAYDEVNNRLGIGTNSPAGILHTEKAPGAGNNTDHFFDTYNDDPATGHTNMWLRRSNSDVSGTATQTVDGQVLGNLIGAGVDSNNAFAGGGVIQFVQNGAAGSSRIPTDIAFFTSPGGTTSPQQRAVIDKDGNVGIGITSPDASAILDIVSTTKGLVPPRMTTTQRDAIASPAKGLFLYNTTTDQWEGNNGTPGSPNWVILG